MVHNRDRAKNYTNILIEHTVNHLQRFIGLKTTRPDPLLMPLRLLPKYRRPNYKVSIFFTLLKIPPILHLLLLLLVSRVYSQREVENKNKNYWLIVKMPLPRSVICSTVHFLMRIQDMAQNSFFPDTIKCKAMQAWNNAQSQNYLMLRRAACTHTPW